MIGQPSLRVLFSLWRSFYHGLILYHLKNLPLMESNALFEVGFEVGSNNKEGSGAICLDAVALAFSGMVMKLWVYSWILDTELVERKDDDG